jgi:integrase/recombinase XerC
MRSLEWLVKALEDTSFEDISNRHIEKAVITLQDLSKTGSRRSAATMNRIKSTFRSFFKWAFQSGLISHNPAASLRMPKTASQRTIPITKQEINALLHTISESDYPCAERDEALFATYAFTGIRCAEALALRIKNYDRSSVTLYLPKVKGANGRLQPISHRLSRILRKWISSLRRKGQGDLNSLLFCGRHSERSLTTRQVRFRFNRWKALSGIREDLTVHSFRSGFATQLYRTTGDFLLVHLAMGHSDVRTTVRYIGNSLFEVLKAIEKGFY